MAHVVYQPLYTNSRALIIGIDKYKHASPLIHACQDAKAVAHLIVSRFAFPKNNVELLLDRKATRDGILRAYLRYADKSVVTRDDRILVFFAGHGHTVSGQRGEAGFLVPVDGKTAELSTLIRWDELTRNAELIPAKHILFFMDACYGGLAFTRNANPAGRMRFLKDMLQRYSRQVLTAGKADEVVSDGDGTRPGHSIFTSRVLDAMEGVAGAPEGIITATGIMSYVYEKVSKDVHSHQTPHYGFIDGDGDFVFDTSALQDLANTPETERDLLVEAPAYSAPPLPSEDSAIETVKRLLANPDDKIRLDDFLSIQLRKTIQALGPDNFPVQAPVLPGQITEEFPLRLKRYEDAVSDVTQAAILFAKWAQPNQLTLLEKIFNRLAEVEKGQSGLTIWIQLGWYPVSVVMYAAGISALSAGRYDTLRTCLLTSIYASRLGRSAKSEPIILATFDKLDDGEYFKCMPGMEQRYTPRSDHLFKTLQPLLEDQLFLGQSYEPLFDQFEIMLALTFGNIWASNPPDRVWGPLGRFAWKQHRLGAEAPFSQFIAEAQRLGPNWSALQHGFFGGSQERFRQISDGIARLLADLHWR